MDVRMDRINVGLIGFGTVGTGLVRILQEHGKLLEQRLGVPMVLKRIADQDVTRDRGMEGEPGPSHDESLRGPG